MPKNKTALLHLITCDAQWNFIFLFNLPNNKTLSHTTYFNLGSISLHKQYEESLL